VIALFFAFLLILAVQRLGELRVSARHEVALRARGAVEAGAGHFPMEVVAQVVWMAAMVVEVLFLGARPWSVWWVFALLYVAAEALRAWAIATLGERWTVRVLVLPGTPLVAGGPYRWMRHPNYVAVAIETVAAPLIFGGWRSAIVGAVFYGAALAVRLQVEDRALRNA